jgi:hypothetical protein
MMLQKYPGKPEIWTLSGKKAWQPASQRLCLGYEPHAIAGLYFRHHMNMAVRGTTDLWQVSACQVSIKHSASIMA